MFAWLYDPLRLIYLVKYTLQTRNDNSSSSHERNYLDPVSTAQIWMLIFSRCHDVHISFPRNEMRHVSWHSSALAAKGCCLSYRQSIDPSFRLKLHRLTEEGYPRRSLPRDHCPGCLLCVCLTYAPTAIYYPVAPKFSVNYPGTFLARINVDEPASFEHIWNR